MAGWGGVSGREVLNEDIAKNKTNVHNFDFLFKD